MPLFWGGQPPITDQHRSGEDQPSHYVQVGNSPELQNFLQGQLWLPIEAISQLDVPNLISFMPSLGCWSQELPHGSLTY